MVFGNGDGYGLVVTVYIRKREKSVSGRYFPYGERRPEFKERSKKQAEKGA